MPNSPYSKVFLITKQILFLEFDASSIDILIYFYLKSTLLFLQQLIPELSQTASVWVCEFPTQCFLI